MKATRDVLGMTDSQGQPKKENEEGYYKFRSSVMSNLNCETHYKPVMCFLQKGDTEPARQEPCYLPTETFQAPSLEPHGLGVGVGERRPTWPGRAMPFRSASAGLPLAKSHSSEH